METFPKPICWLGMEKQNPNTTKGPIKRNALEHKVQAKNLKPGSVASHDIRPGNGEGLLWYRHFINLLTANWCQ